MSNNWFSLQWFSYSTLRDFVWEKPYFLYGLLLIPLLFVFRQLFNSRRSHRLNVAFLSRDVRTSWISYLRHVPAIFFGLGMVCLVMAMARPQRISQEQEQTSEGIDIMLAIDISASMTTQDITPSRLEVAKQVAKDFVKGRFQDRIGLVVFSGEALMLCPLTTDYELLNDFIDDLKPSLITTSGTAIGSALGRCVTRLQEIDSKSRVTILLSDGANTAGNLDPLMAAQLAQAFGIKIYTIAVGTEKTAQTEAVDESTLREIAQKAEGLFFRATDARSLSSIFQRINTLEKIEVNNSSFQNITDYYQMYVRWGIVFVLMAFFCKNTFMGNILED